MDYTKYNFNAIVGAEVEIGNQRKIFGKVVCSTDEAVIIQLTKDLNSLRKGETMYLVKGTILSLSAKITPRRMNLEQLKKFAEDEAKQENADEWSLTIDNKGLSFDFASQGHKGIGVYINVDEPLSCTEWGWHKN